MPASVPSPYQALYRFNYSPLLLLHGSLARLTHCRARLLNCCENMGKADEEEVGVKQSLCRRSKILIHSVYTAIVIGWFMLSIQPMGHWLLAVPAWQKKHSVGSLSASAHGENNPVCPITNPTLCEKQTERRLKTAVWEYDTQTTALGWIKQASVTLAA